MSLQLTKHLLGLAAIVWLLLGSGTILSQTTFSANANRTTVGVNQNFQVNFILKNGTASKIKPPSFEGFQILSGPNVSQRMEMINFDMTRSVTWSYILRPTSEGTFAIGKASIDEKGKRLETEELKIEVTTAVTKNNQQSQGGQSQSGGDGEISKKELAENLFVRQFVSKSKVHVGEQITVTYKLYHRVTITNTIVKNAPSYEGFWTQGIEMGNTQQFKQEDYNGQRYETLVLRKDAIFPQRPGTLQLKPLELETVIRAQVKGRPRSIFDEMFGNYRVKNIPFEFQSNGTTIEVTPLPKNQPSDFGGAVGSFKMETSLDRFTTETNEPVTLTIKISGQGNIRMIDEPKIEIPGNFEVYDPQVKEYISKTSNVVSGSKKFDYLIVPRAPGQYKIPPISFSYFDPGQNTFKTEQSETFTLTVEGDPVESNGSITGISKEDVELLGQDIRYIKTKTADLEIQSRPFFGSPLFFGMLGAPFLLFIGLIAVRRRNEELAGDVASSRNRKANKLARRRMKEAEKFMKSNDRKGFYDEVVKGIWGYLSDKFNMDQASLSRENVQERLKQKNYSQELADQLFELIDHCEMALFAPSGSAQSLNDAYSKAIDILSKLERAKK